MDVAIATEVFAALRRILQPYAQNMDVQADNRENYCLNCKIEVKKGMPLFFAAVRMGKNYVSYHLMPVYMNPVLQAAISPELKKHMQGKSCFNFKKMDKDLFKELEMLTAKGAECFKGENLQKVLGTIQGTKKSA